MNRRTTTALRWIRRLTVSLAVFAGAAQAASYNAIWDPPFGAALPGLGWSGSALIDVPDECEPSGSGLVSNLLPFSSGGCAGQARIRQAEVVLYDLSEENEALPRTLDFSTAFPSLLPLKLLYEDGDLEQLWSTPSNLVRAGFTDSNMRISHSTFFQLTFLLDGPRLAFWDCPRTHSSILTTAFGCRFGGVNDSTRFPPEFEISRVPEPASLWLASLALFGVAVATRRRSRRV